MNIATWNVNSLSVRLPQVLDWLAAHPTEVLALQELKLTDDKFPAAAFHRGGLSGPVVWPENLQRRGADLQSRRHRRGEEHPRF
jgi:exonuclease III